MRNLFGRRRTKNESKAGSEGSSVKISGPIGQVEHRIHIDHEKSRDHGYEARFYRRHLDPTLSTRVLQNSLYVKIPAVSDDFVNEMTIEMSRLTKTQSMDALDNYELVENEKQISVCSPTRTQSAGLKRNVSKSWHDNLDAICSNTTTPTRTTINDDDDDSSTYSRDTSMETTTSSSLPPPFTPDDIREASLNLSQEQRQRPIPKARSIENIADVSTSSSEQDDREQKLKILLKKFGPYDEYDDYYKPAPVPPERKSKTTPNGSSGDESPGSSIPKKPCRTDLASQLTQNVPVPKPRQTKRPPSPESYSDHAVYL